MSLRTIALFVRLYAVFARCWPSAHIGRPSPCFFFVEVAGQIMMPAMWYMCLTKAAPLSIPIR